MRPRRWRLLLLAAVVCSLRGRSGSSSSSSSHSLRYLHMAIWETGQKWPYFLAMGYLDDQLFASYSSKTKEYHPRVPWAKKKLDSSYWEEQTRIGQGNEKLYRVDLVILRNRYNQSEGLHTLQYMAGCELKKDRSKGGYYQFGYDGKDFLSLDMETLTWTAVDAAAQVTQRKLEADTTLSQARKYYLEETCIKWLRKFLFYANEALLRREPPVVKVTFRMDYNDVETLTCQAYGFYPKEIHATWRKGEEILEHMTFHRSIAPNSDGTYHTWLSIQTRSAERNQYQCHVEHDGLLEPVVLGWEDPGDTMQLLVSASCSAVFLAFFVAGIAVCIRKRRKDDYQATSVSDRGFGDSSNGNEGTHIPRLENSASKSCWGHFLH